MRPTFVMAVAGLAVLAGCGGPAAGPGTLTPAPIPTASPTASPTPTPVPTVAPGVSRRGVTDPVALAEAHAARLQATSYTVRVNRSVRYANGTLRNRRRKVTRAWWQGNRYYRQIAVEGRTAPPPIASPPGRVEQWSNGVWMVSRVTVGGDHAYRSLGPDEYDRVREYYEPLPNQEALAVRLAALETRVDSSTGTGESTRKAGRDGGTEHRVVATGLVDPERFALGERAEAPRNLTMWLRVSDRGFVRETYLRYEGILQGHRVVVTRTVEYGGLGETTVERPDWYATARERGVAGPPVEPGPNATADPSG